MGEFPSGQRGQTVNLLLFSFDGPNPSSPTKQKRHPRGCLFCFRRQMNEDHRKMGRRRSQITAQVIWSAKVSSKANDFGHRPKRSKSCRRRVSILAHQTMIPPKRVVFLFALVCYDEDHRKMGRRRNRATAQVGAVAKVSRKAGDFGHRSKRSKSRRHRVSILAHQNNDTTQKGVFLFAICRCLYNKT